MQTQPRPARPCISGAFAMLIALSAASPGLSLPISPSWQQITTGSPAPSPRRGVAGILDAPRDRFLFQGGEEGVTFLPDTWTLGRSPSSWTGPGTANPSPRCHHRMLADFDRGRALLFGGFPRNNELWSYDLQNDSWTEITPASNNPTPRCLHSALIDHARNEMIVYGGLNGGGTPDLEDVWTYDLVSGAWTERTPTSPPGQRYGHVAAIDPPNDRMIVFGGLKREHFIPLDVNDLWEYDLQNGTWTWIEQNGIVPSPRQFARGAALPDASGMILFGGRSEGTYMQDLWLLSFETLFWHQIVMPGPSPPPRYRHTLILDETARVLYVAFGQNDSGELNDIWSLDLSTLGQSSATTWTLY